MFAEQQIALSQVRLDKANEDLETSRDNLNGGKYNAAVNRAYYAMFHAMRSVFALVSIDFKSHQAALGYFNKEYVNTGAFDPKYFKMIRSAFSLRGKSDYEDYFNANEEEAVEHVVNAKRFIEAVEAYIEKCIQPQAEDEYEPEIGD